MRIAHHAMTWEGWWQSQKLEGSASLLLRELRSAGYDAMEIGVDEPRYGPARALRRQADDAGVGIVAVASHVTANPWPPNTQQYRREMDYAAELGVRLVMVCGGFLGYRRTTFDGDYALFAQNLAVAGDYAAGLGLRIAYHPHLNCIVETIAETAWLLRHAPLNLGLCLDTGHLIAAGDDPVRFIEQFGSRVLHVHLKDRDLAASTFTELGDGNAGLDFGRIIHALRHVKYDGSLVVERDSPPVPAMESARRSRAFLAQWID